jgi:hypothetical protein
VTADLFGATSSAVLSECGTYRYELRRTWSTGPAVGWIMLNPSTADADTDDATIRKCVRYAKAWGYGGIVVRNLYALRSRDPKALKRHDDPVGPDNYAHLGRAAKDALTVCAWGANADAADVQRAVGSLIVAGVRLHVLALTKDGQPGHPLFLPGHLRPYLWPEAHGPFPTLPVS